MAKEYILSIPVVLILEVGDTLGSSWKVPPNLLPLGKKFAADGVKYNLVAQIYTNYTVELGPHSHFIARYVTPDGDKIFDYDGMKHDGHAEHRPGAKLSGWLSGQSNKLNRLPVGYRLMAVIYHLEGGGAAQQVFRAERQKAAPWGLQLDVDPTSNQSFPQFAQLVQPHLKQLTKDERQEWASDKRQAQAVEYQMDEPHELLHKDKVTKTGRFKRELIAVNDSSPETSSNEDADHDSLDELILETIGASARPKPQRPGTSLTSSKSSNSFPINCYGCGEISDGDDNLKQVQCSSCDFWSHCRCQPEDGEVDWNDPQVIFICQGCRPREAAQLWVPAHL